MNVKKYACVLLCLTLAGCSRTVSDADKLRAQRYYQYLPVCQSLSDRADLPEEQLAQIEEAFQSRCDAYEQTMYHIVEQSSYMNQINYLAEGGQISLQNYSPMAAVLYQHMDEIGMNPILLMRRALEGDGSPATEYDSYTDNISCTETSSRKEITEENRTSPDRVYSGTPETFIRNLFSEFYDGTAELKIGTDTDEDGNPELYYVYLIEFREDIECYAWYFYVNDDGICYQAAMDYLLYGGNELAALFRKDAALAGDGHAEEKTGILEEILDVPPSRSLKGAYDGYALCVSGFTREYLHDTEGTLARFAHYSYVLQEESE